jgi:hypothetical protein
MKLPAVSDLSVDSAYNEAQAEREFVPLDETGD